MERNSDRYSDRVDKQYLYSDRYGYGDRWIQWMKASEERKARLDKELAIRERSIARAMPLPKYRMWITGGKRAYDPILFDGERIGLVDTGEGLVDLDFIEDRDVYVMGNPGHWERLLLRRSFMIRVDSPEEAIGLARRITRHDALGLEELEDGEYYEWYDENGDDLDKFEGSK